jgi:hypothetical protein
MNPAHRKFAISAVISVLVPVCIAVSARGADKITWKSVPNAILKITGRKPPKVWNVYQDEKNKECVLVEMDSRYLILNAKTKEVFEITASQFQAHGKGFQSVNPASTQHALPSSDWDIRDIGPAERIQARLTADAILFDVELPHPLVLRTPY